MYGPLNLSQYIYSGKLLNDWNDEDMDAEGLFHIGDKLEQPNSDRCRGTIQCKAGLQMHHCLMHRYFIFMLPTSKLAVTISGHILSNIKRNGY